MIPSINRRHVEHYVLGSIINGNISMPLDAMEFAEMNIDYKLFKSTYSTKLIAKAIHNMKNEGLPVDDVLLKSYIDSKTNKLDNMEYFEIICAGTGSYLSVLNYLDLLKRIDREEKLWSRI